MEKLRVGIIGCGGIANGKHMPALSKMGDVEITAFCDLVPERAEAAAKQYGAPGAKVYTDYRALLEDKSIDNVRVLTHNAMHCPITVDALEAGKNVLCEKPMAITFKEAHLMTETAKRTGKLLTIGYQHRYDLDVVYSKKEAEKGALGKIYYARSYVLRRRSVPTHGVFIDKEKQGGGCIIDIGTHAIDTALYIAGNFKPKYVSASMYFAYNKRSQCGNAFGDWDTEKMNVEDSGFGFVIMENGMTLIIETSSTLNVTHFSDSVSYQICGDIAGVSNYRGDFTVVGDNNNTMYTAKPEFNPKGVAFNDGQAYSPVYAEQRRFIDACRGEAEILTKPEEAEITSKIIEGMYISAQSGKPYFFE